MMSNILNKTFNLAVASLSNKSDEFVDTNAFIQAIEHVENKSEHICKFLNHLKRSFNSLSYSHQHKYLTVLVYCTQLGIENNAIKECVLGLGGIVTTFIEQSKDVYRKKLGYLALTALVNLESSEVVYLAVNTILKDITCNNKEFIMISLDAICQLVTIDLVPVLLPVVEQRLRYKDAAVRIKAFRALECIYKVGSEFVNNTRKHVKLALSDYSPEVMASALPHLHCIVKKDSASYEDLPPVLVSILKQVVNGKLPQHMSLHGISAPFTQIYILKILQHLTINNETKETLADILLNMMNRCQSSKQNISYSILSECIEVTLRFYHNKEAIFNVAVESLGSFFNSSEANYLLTGICLLTQVAKINPLFCVQYQKFVVDCLSHTDNIVKKQTFMLLQVLINKENCQVMCNKMLSEFNIFDDENFTKTFSDNLSRTAVKYSSDLTWLLLTLHLIMEKFGDSVSSTVSERLLDQVAIADSNQLLTELEECLTLLDTNLSFHHFEAIVFILSKFLKELKQPVDKIVSRVIQQSKAQLADCQVTSRKPEIVFNLISFTKHALHRQCSDEVLKQVVDVASAYTNTYPVLQQSLFELDVLSKHKELLDLMSDTDIEFSDDSWLSQYESAEEQEKHVEEAEVSLKVRPYSMQNQPVIKTNTALMASMFMQPSPSSLGESFLSKNQSDDDVSVWGEDGYLRTKTSTTLNLNEALQNISTMTEPDKAMADMVKDAFSSTVLRSAADDNDHT